MLFKKLMLKKLYSRKIVPFEIPGDARELTEDEMLLVNGGGGSMSPEDQQAMAEAGRRGDVEAQNAIRAKYENNTPTTPANPTQPVTATTTVTTPQPANSGTADITPADGGIGSSNSPESSGGSSSGGSNGNNSPKPSITPQISTPVSQQDHNLKVGAAHVEDYKKAAMKSLGIKENSSSGRKVPGWRNNGDGTHTVISKEANLWNLYGPNWKELSGYEGDPTKLHVGDTVGKKIKVNQGAGDMTVTERIELAKGAGNNKFSNTNSGYEIDHETKTIKVDLNDKKALIEAADKFQTYETLNDGYKLQGYCSDGSYRTYSKFSELSSEIYKSPWHGDIFLTAEIDIAAGLGVEGSISLVVDLDNWKDSGINFSGGVAAGLNVGVGVGIGYTPRDLEGSMPVGVDGNFGCLPFSIAAMTDEKGFNGGSFSFGPGMGLSSSTQKSYTLSINNIIDFFN